MRHAVGCPSFPSHRQVAREENFAIRKNIKNQEVFHLLDLPSDVNFARSVGVVTNLKIFFAEILYFPPLSVCYEHWRKRDTVAHSRNSF